MSPDPFKNRKPGGKAVPVQDPAQALQKYGVHGSRQEPSNIPPTTRRIITVPIEKIRPGRYQKRENIDEVKYQQLKEQIQELGLQFTAVLCQDPDHPDFYNLMMGGHIRIQAAKELGITEVQAIMRDYDRLALAKGTYFENNGRQSLTLMEEGHMFLQLQEDEGWSQEKIASELKVNRSHVSLCILAATASPDIKNMLSVDPTRGQRCFYYLKQLDDLGIEKAVKLRAPIIQSFLEEKISTDQVKHLVEQILHREKGEDVGEVSIETAKGKEKSVSILHSFQRYEKVLGDRAPSASEREDLTKVKQKIDEILARNN